MSIGIVYPAPLFLFFQALFPYFADGRRIVYQSAFPENGLHQGFFDHSLKINNFIMIIGDHLPAICL